MEQVNGVKVTEELLQQAEQYKAKGNEYFKELKFEESIEEYTKAINFKLNSPKTAVYYSNRAFCHIKIENYGLALEDATEALIYDPKYSKAYYRRASAYFALAKYDQALGDFKKAAELNNNDTETLGKIKLIKKIQREKLFAESIRQDDPNENIDANSIAVPASYTGPKLEENQEVTKEWVENLLEYMRDQKILHKKYLWNLLARFRDILKALPSLVDLDIPQDEEITVCGDIHGQYYDVLNIWKMNGYPSAKNPYLFNGDFVDRGSFSVECIIALIAWKVYDPNCIHLNRGNHETKNLNKLYGFEGEVVHKYDSKTFDLFAAIFQFLPIAYCLNKKVLVLHGGLFSKDGVKLEDIRKINRISEPPDTGIMCEALWSDPVKQNGRHPSKRGVALGFGPDVSKKFLDDNGLELLVRSHEVKDQGYEVEADGRVITIFSAPNYCDQMGNKGAFIRFSGKDMKPKFTQFSAVEHPKVPVMAYTKGYLPWM